MFFFLSLIWFTLLFSYVWNWEDKHPILAKIFQFVKEVYKSGSEPHILKDFSITLYHWRLYQEQLKVSTECEVECSL